MEAIDLSVNPLSFTGTYIVIEHVRKTASGKTHIWRVHNNGVHLGEIKWFSRWRKYSFFPAVDTVFETVCLDEISEFLKNAKDITRSA